MTQRVDKPWEGPATIATGSWMNIQVIAEMARANVESCVRRSCGKIAGVRA